MSTTTVTFSSKKLQRVEGRIVLNQSEVVSICKFGYDVLYGIMFGGSAKIRNDKQVQKRFNPFVTSVEEQILRTLPVY